MRGGVTHRCTYLLPIRRTRFDEPDTADFLAYFRTLAAAGCEVLIVDGSPPPVFAAHHRAWSSVAIHITVDPRYPYLNGKVNGIHTGVAVASCERIILADDDIRYSRQDIDCMCRLLTRHELVRPQNHLSPLPIWARLEAARMLLNRGVLPTGDYPGTCGVRRSAMLRVGHYDGDVLFDNEELVRHFVVKGADVCYATDFFVLKRPPTFRKWLEQRPRQAYEDFVMRLKTVAFMALLPTGVAIGLSWGSAAVMAYASTIAAAAIAVAARGRRGRARRFFPAAIALAAPLWILERSLSVYWALYWYLRRGGYPFGDKLLSKGTGAAWVAGGRLSTMSAGHQRVGPVFTNERR